MITNYIQLRYIALWIVWGAVVSTSSISRAGSQIWSPKVEEYTQVFDENLTAKFDHHYEDIDGVTLHYVTVKGSAPSPLGDQRDLVVLLHGWPNSWYHWRYVMPELAKDYAVVAVEYRGACNSSKPEEGYDKKTMAKDIYKLVRKLGYESVKLVGFDIGLMISYAYAAQFPKGVEKLVLIDAMLPGTSFFDRIQCSPRSWHFHLHRQEGLSEMLVSGRERRYLKWFYDNLSIQRERITRKAFSIYSQCYSKPGALTAGFNLYRAFDQDVEDNRAFMNQKIQMPVLGIGSPIITGPFLFDMLSEVASNVRTEIVPDSGHWIAEEKPEFLLNSIISFFEAN